MKYDGSFYFNSIKNYLDSYYSFDKEHFNFIDILKLRRFFKSVRPDIVFSFSTTLSHYALLLKLFGPFQYRLINGSIRNAPVDLNMEMKFEKLMYNFYDEVVANSKAGLNVYKQEGKRGRYILYNGFDERRTPENSKIELREQLGINNKFTVTMVASMGDSKDQNTFLRAAYQVLKMDGDIQFYLIGDGPRKSEHEILVESFGIKRNVFFIGEVDNVELYFGAADLSVLTSASWHGEGIPNVVLESLASGTPVIATDNGGTKEILENNYNGYLINNGDYKTLAEKILFLKNNPIRVKSFSENGLKIVRENFSIDKMISSFEDIINLY